MKWKYKGLNAKLSISKQEIKKNSFKLMLIFMMICKEALLMSSNESDQFEVVMNIKDTPTLSK